MKQTVFKELLAVFWLYLGKAACLSVFQWVCLSVCMFVYGLACNADFIKPYRSPVYLIR